MNVAQQSSDQNNLQFTGNWFIDAGIIGFVNVMEEVYGWDLDKLLEEIKNDEVRVYYGYFPFARLLKDKYKDKIEEEDKDLVEELTKELSSKKFSTTEGLYNYVWRNFICKSFKNKWVMSKIIKEKNIKNKKYIKDLKDYLTKQNMSNTPQLKERLDELIKDWEENVIKNDNTSQKAKCYYRIPIKNSFYTNFLFYNNSSDHSEQRSSFYDAISFNLDKEEKLKIIDKTVNKFLPSEDKFQNINYTKFSTKNFKSEFKYLFVYLLCFIHAFENYLNMDNVFFYSNDLRFTYIINKKLKKYKNRMIINKKLKKYKNRMRSNESDIIFRITWQQIIDILVEYKSSWSLENMYIISYRQLDNQNQVGVKYIGVQKLQASILLDDTIRYYLNNYIEFRSDDSKTDRYSWLLEEFIKGKPLYPIIMNHVNIRLNDKKDINKKDKNKKDKNKKDKNKKDKNKKDKNKKDKKLLSSLYSLIIEAKISEFKSMKKQCLFSDNYFDNYRTLVKDIKEDIRFTSFGASLINQISNDSEIKKRIARELFNALKSKDKNIFLNILLKYMNRINTLNTNLYNWIFEKIIKNDISYEMYGLILVINLLRSSDKNE